MKKAKLIGIRELKNRLSACINEIQERKGGFLVTDRGTVVAELIEPRLSTGLHLNNPLLMEWVRSGLLLPSKEKLTLLPKSLMTTKAGTVTRLLEEERSE